MLLHEHLHSLYFVDIILYKMETTFEDLELRLSSRIFVCFSRCNRCCGVFWTGDLFGHHLLWSRLSTQVIDYFGFTRRQLIGNNVRDNPSA